VRHGSVVPESQSVCSTADPSNPTARACKRGRSHSPLTARVLSLLVMVVLACGVSPAARAVARSLPLGRSQDGRPVVSVRVGDPQGTRLLVVGCIHGTECAGLTVARALEPLATRLDLWIVPNLNPDG